VGHQQYRPTAVGQLGASAPEQKSRSRSVADQTHPRSGGHRLHWSARSDCLHFEQAMRSSPQGQIALRANGPHGRPWWRARIDRLSPAASGLARANPREHRARCRPDHGCRRTGIARSPTVGARGATRRRERSKTHAVRPRPASADRAAPAESEDQALLLSRFPDSNFFLRYKSHASGRSGMATNPCRGVCVRMYTHAACAMEYPRGPLSAQRQGHGPALNPG